MLGVFVVRRYIWSCTEPSSDDTHPFRVGVSIGSCDCGGCFDACSRHAEDIWIAVVVGCRVAERLTYVTWTLSTLFKSMGTTIFPFTLAAKR
jgi:hypothetical protein